MLKSTASLLLRKPSTTHYLRKSCSPWLISFLLVNTFKRSTTFALSWRNQLNHRRSQNRHSLSRHHASTMSGGSFEDARAFNSYASAAVELSAPHLSDDGLFTTVRSARDIDQGKRRRFLYSVATGEGNKTITLPPAEFNDDIMARIPSLSGRKIAVFREEGTKDSPKRQHVVEVWEDNALSRRILLPSSKHGKPIFDAATFGGPSWNPDETVLVYTAERRAPETTSFFDPETDSANRGLQHTLGWGQSEKWGEKYPKQYPLFDLFLLNVETGNVGLVENCPMSDNAQETSLGSFALGQPVFEPTRGETIVYTAYDAGGGPDMPKRLGLIYCQQRPSKLYASPVANLLHQIAQEVSALAEDTSEKDEPCYCLTPNTRLARSPVFGPVVDDTTKLAYISSKDGFDTHSGCFGLSTVDWKSGCHVASSQRTVLQPVWDPEDSPVESGSVHGLKFPGLFLQQLASNCFLSHKYLLATTQWGSVSKIVRICLDTGSVIPIHHEPDKEETDLPTSDEMRSDSFLFANPETGVVGVTAAPNKVPVVWCAPTAEFLGEEAQKVLLFDEKISVMDSISAPIAASKFSPVPLTPKLDFNCEMQLIPDGDLPDVDGADTENIPVQTILLLPKDSSVGGDAKKLPPLVVVPHGGPHSVSLTSFMHSTAFLCGHGGYAVALVNYRGSTGFGQKGVSSLPGRIGSLDVKDVAAATMKIKTSGLVDPNRIGICGGSHGGFLTAHLTGQYPDLFRAAVMRNPVVNLPSMATATDIPDWVYVEGLGMGKYKWTSYNPPASKDELSELWSKSPVQYVSKVKTPTLVALGMADLRVPPSQGLEWYHSLRAKRSVPTKLLMYDDNDHAIIGTAAEADHWINIKQWFDEHL